MHWLEELLHTYGQLKVAGEANALDDNRKILAMDQQVVEAHHRHHLKEAFRPPQADSEEDMIHIGDRHDHHHSPASSSGKLLKWLAALALLGTGAGSGLGGMLLIQQFLNPPQTSSPVSPEIPNTPSTPPDDEDTLFELRLGPPKQR